MKITKSQLQKIIKEELLKEAGRPHSMRSGRTMADLDAESDDEALEAASDYVSRLAQKTGQKFGIEKLISPQGDRV